MPRFFGTVRSSRISISASYLLIMLTPKFSHSVFIFAPALRFSIFATKWSLCRRHIDQFHLCRISKYCASYRGLFSTSCKTNDETNSVLKSIDGVEIEAYCPDPSCPRITSLFPQVPLNPLPPLISHIKTSRSWSSISLLLTSALKVSRAPVPCL